MTVPSPRYQLVICAVANIRVEFAFPYETERFPEGAVFKKLAREHVQASIGTLESFDNDRLAIDWISAYPRTAEDYAQSLIRKDRGT